MLLVELERMPLVRGFQLRHDRIYEPAGLQHALSETTSKAEAALMFCVGVIQEGDNRCMSCQRGQGPFPQCVRLFHNGNVSACANCHWDSNDPRCAFHIPSRETRRPEANLGS